MDERVAGVAEEASTRYYLAVASLDHALAGKAGGFAQMGHGKHAPVKGLRKGDWIVYYSPREHMGEGDAVRSFTTIGQVTSEAAYKARQGETFEPWRVDVSYLDAKPAPITPLLDRLELTRERGRNWGIVMRGSKRTLSQRDFRLIAEAMEARI